MSDKPCPVIPRPMVMRLVPGGRPWPQRFEVVRESPLAEPFRAHWETRRVGRAHHNRTEKAVGTAHPTKIHLRASRKPGVPGSYEIHFDKEDVTVAADSADGFRHALQTWLQLSAGSDMPIGVIEDGPTLAIRGFHLNFESYRRLDAAAARQMIESAARFKLNTLLVEYGPRFPFTAHREIVDDAAALSPDEVASLCATAQECGIELIPLQQSLAHLDYALRRDAWSHLRERSPRHGLMCPSHPESFERFTTLAGEMIALHGGGRFFHVGGDEARKIGECPRCRPRVEREGVGAIYGEYMEKVTRWVLAQGRRPIIWDDTLCAHPDALARLPRETIIQYWDYIAVEDPTTVLIPRMAHARGGPRVVHDWRWHLPPKRRRLSESQRGIMNAYSQPAMLRTALGDEFLREFEPYLGGAFPRMVRALPYLEYYQDRGFDVITSPTGMGNGDMEDGAPNFVRFDHNIQTHARRCIENGRALGIITTAWYDMPPELLTHPMILTAMAAW